MKHGKKYTDSKKLIDPLKYYEAAEAIELVKQTGKAKFDETVELSIRLGVDPRHADQQVRGAVVLQHGTGKTVRVLVFAGPKGRKPNPKSGTVTMDVTKAISDIKAGKVEYRVDKTAIAHCPIGKVSFESEKLSENLTALMEAIIKAKPATAKGTYVKSLYLSTTMGPSIRLNTTKF